MRSGMSMFLLTAFVVNFQSCSVVKLLIEFTSKHVIKIQPTMIQNVMWQNSNIVPEAF